MNVFQKLFLYGLVVLLFTGIIFNNSRPIVIPLGLGVLFVCFTLEKFFYKNKRYRIEVFDSKSECDVSLVVESSQLLISDKWSLDGCLKLNGFDGIYKIQICEISGDGLSFISEIKIISSAELSGEIKDLHSTVLVDTGWLLFLASSAKENFDSKKLKTIIQGELKVLSADKPLCIWLRDDKGQKVGVVVSTGEGDGVYHINYRMKGDQLVMVEANFIKT